MANFFDTLSDAINANKEISMASKHNLIASIPPSVICVRVYKARGIVRVSVGMFETNVMVAPNSPRLLAKANIIPVIIPGVISGSVIEKNVRKGPTPNVLEASSSPLSTFSIDNRIERTIRGKAIIADAIAAPFQLKAKFIPTLFNNIPKKPLLPKVKSNIYPVTTGGTTRGRCTKPSNKTYPTNSCLASIHDTNIPIGRLTKTAHKETFKLSFMASISKGDKVSIPI